MPQVVFARPSWSTVDSSNFCSLTLNNSLQDADGLTLNTGVVYIKAVMDHKYDGIQVRDLTVSLVLRRRRGDDAVDIFRESLLHLPVNASVSRLQCSRLYKLEFVS